MLILEDGTGVAGSNAYVTAQQVSEYALARGLVFVPGESGEAAILRATQWLDGAYAKRFPGYRTHGRQQGLQWPRAKAQDASGISVDIDEVPTEIIRASCAAAIFEYSTPSGLSPAVTPGKVMTAASVDGAVSVQYKAEGGADGQRPVLTAIDDILSSLLTRKPSPTVVGTLARA